MSLPTRLSATPLEKVWGSPLTEPWYRNPDGLTIGELWFDASEEWPLLVKILFTREKLSVQVHPDDKDAHAHGYPRGKTEMWHILRAEPGATIGLGPIEPLSRESLREASGSGAIDGLLRWLPAKAGDTFFAPAGTIHALGAGLVLCEVQQRSDVTLRLYDYGRGRELNVDRALDVALLDPFEGRVTRGLSAGGPELLAECAYFRTERLTVEGSVLCPEPAKGTLYIALEGDGLIAGQPFRGGEAWEARPGTAPFRIESESAVFLITSEPN